MMSYPGYTKPSPDRQAKIDQELAQASDTIRKYVHEVRERLAAEDADRFQVWSDLGVEVMLGMSPAAGLVVLIQALWILAEGGYDVEALGAVA